MIQIVDITIAAFTCCWFFRVKTVPSIPEAKMTTTAQPGEFDLVSALCDGVFPLSRKMLVDLHCSFVCRLLGGDDVLYFGTDCVIGYWAACGIIDSGLFSCDVSCLVSRSA